MSQTRLERSERSSSRFAGVSRVGLRVVVVAGIAGAAWALSATAASAAPDPHSASVATSTPGSPLTSLVGGTIQSLLGTGAPATTPSESTHASDVLTPLLSSGTGLLSQVLAPISTAVSPHGTATASMGTGKASDAAGPRTAEATPGASSRDTIQVAASAHDRSNDAALTDEFGAGSNDLVRTVTDLTAPLGLELQPTLDVLQPMIGVVDPLTAPLDQLLSSVDGVSTPIFDELDAVTRPVTEVDTRSTAGATPATATAVAMPTAPTSLLTAVPETMEIATAPVRVDEGTSARRAIARHGTRGAPAQWSSPLGSDQHNVPANQLPVPALPVPALGTVSTTGSGSHEDNGGVAVLSAPFVRDVGIQLRSSRATGLAVRRLIVENPTVSPD
jgi:hypothetical protein